MATVRIPTPLRRHTGGERLVTAHGGTVAEVLEDLCRRHPGLARNLFDGAGGLQPFLVVFVDEQDVRLLQGSATRVGEESQISVIPAMAGGGLAGLAVSPHSLTASTPAPYNGAGILAWQAGAAGRFSRLVADVRIPAGAWTWR